MRLCALAVAAALVGAASAPSARESTALPQSGLAVETGTGVTLVALDGRVVRTLPGFRLRFGGVMRLGQVALRDPSEKQYELRGGVLRRVPQGTITLPAGYRLRFAAGRWTLLRDGRSVERFASFTHLELDDSGVVLTIMRVAHDGRVLSRSAARNLSSGARLALPRGCRVGAARLQVRFELCGYPFVKNKAASIVRVDANGRRVLAGSDVYVGQHGPTGAWETVELSPGGRRLLAQRTGECEVPEAHVFDARRGSFRTSVLATTRDGAAAEALTLGWVGQTALVALPRGACGPSVDRPGVYAYSPSGPPKLVYRLSGRATRSVALWR